MAEIDERLFRAFRGEVRQQCVYALMALDGVAAAESESAAVKQRSLENPDAGVDVALLLDRCQTRFWYSIQAFLTACANISKLCWPNKRQRWDESEDDCRFRVHRGELVETSLGLDDTSPLKSRELRNSFEHMDERLDRWARTSTQHSLLSRCIGAPGGIVFTHPLGPNDTVGYYDRAACTVTFQGDPIPLIPMIEAVQQLYARLQAGN